MITKIEKYGNRNWGVYYEDETKTELIAVTVYKKGAKSVQAIADKLIALQLSAN